MLRPSVAWLLLAVLLSLTASTSALAQTPEFGSTGEPGSGGAGRSIGGDIPALGVPQEPKEKVLPTDWYSAHAQATVILQGLWPFHSPYTGPHSLVSAYELRTTATSTLFFAAKLPWEGGLLVINPEVAAAAASAIPLAWRAPNGEAVRVGNPQPTPYFARFLLQQTFELGGEWDKLADVANQIPGPRYKNTVVFKIGKMPSTDDFDDNTYAHDPRTQFMNWGLMFNGSLGLPGQCPRLHLRKHPRGQYPGLLVPLWHLRCCRGRQRLRTRPALHPCQRPGSGARLLDRPERLARERAPAVLVEHGEHG